jgi:hypothetical protein
MKITRQIVADKIADYLHGKVTEAELPDYASREINLLCHGRDDKDEDYRV